MRRDIARLLRALAQKVDPIEAPPDWHTQFVQAQRTGSATGTASTDIVWHEK
jgi:hypothetical protein